MRTATRGKRAVIATDIVHYKNMKHAVRHQAMQVVGHRGARGLAPENTLAAIDKALEHQVVEIEIDVHITKDQVAVLAHYPWLNDVAGNTLVIKQTTLQDLRRHKPDLATLDEAIAHINRRVPLQIELKWGEPASPVASVLLDYLGRGWQATDFLFGSKNQRTLLELHRALPEIPTVVIEPYLSVRAHWRARQLKTKRLSMNRWGLWSGFIRAMDRRGYQLYAYTLDDPRKAKRWQAAGLQGVITDRPDLFAAKSNK